MKHEAIYSVYSNVVRIKGEDDDAIAYDADDKVVSWVAEDVAKEEADIEKETGYIQKRVDAYAQFGEQLDQLYHDMAADKGDKSGEWFKAVKKVKDDFPK